MDGADPLDRQDGAVLLVGQCQGDRSPADEYRAGDIHGRDTVMEMNTTSTIEGRLSDIV